MNEVQMGSTHERQRTVSVDMGSERSEEQVTLPLHTLEHLLQLEPGEDHEHTEHAEHGVLGRRLRRSRPTNWVRQNLAYMLISLLALLVLGATAAVFLGDATVVDRMKEWSTAILTPVVGLVGSVVGFFFGARTATTAAKTSQAANLSKAQRDALAALAAAANQRSFPRNEANT